MAAGPFGREPTRQEWTRGSDRNAKNGYKNPGHRFVGPSGRIRQGRQLTAWGGRLRDKTVQPGGTSSPYGRSLAPNGGPRPLLDDANEGERLSFAAVHIDTDSHQVTRDGNEVKVTPLEFDLLLYFLRHPKKAHSRERLLAEVWGQKSGSARTVDNFVAQLRNKLEKNPEEPRHFVTVRGSGYLFDPTGP